MAEIAVSFALEQVFQLLNEEVSLLRGVHKEFENIKDELESIQAFLKDADRRAADEGDTNDGIKTWVRQLREASFRIEDVIDQYLWLARGTGDPRDAAMICKTAFLIKTLISRHRLAYEIHDIKLSVRGIKERSERYNFQTMLERGSSRSRETGVVRWRDPRMASLFIEEAEVVGFEFQRDQLVGWLVEGAVERTVVSVVGMGGLGKTTLAKQVFDSQKVRKHFDCRAFITISQSYTMKGLLIDMKEQFCREIKEPLPQMLHKMDDKSLITEVRQYLQQKRYLVFFDDVWQVDFSDQIQFSMPNNSNGSRIIITTRMMHVAEYFKKSFLVHVHNLQLLPPNKAWELFCKKAFRFELDGHCPAELKDISDEIVQKCNGLPLAIVAIGGLLSTKAKTMFEWKKVTQNLSLELERNAHLTILTKILSLSFYDLPYYLKPCILYFGIYPEDYSIDHKRLTRQWIAEGFVKDEKRRTLEEVAEEYLRELIHRSLVQVTKVGFDGKVKSCQVHDILREVISGKMKDLSFCNSVHEEDELDTVGITRRLSISTSSNYVLRSMGRSQIRAIYVFGEGKLPEPFNGRFSTKFRLLKVLDFEGISLNCVPDNLANLFHLKYLNLRNTKVQAIPKSIGKLQNLETLDLRQTLVHELPSGINKLTKLRHLSVYHRNFEENYSVLGFTTGVLVKKGIDCLTSLQNLYFVEADLNIIQELKSLKQLRRLGLRSVRREYGNALRASIEEMNHLESLNITTISEDEIIDLDFVSTPLQLRWLHLKARLEKLPDWIPKLQYLVKLRLGFCMLKEDPLKSLKNLPNLLRLTLWDNSYDGENLHFQVGGFQKLMELNLTRLNSVNSILIDEGALIALEHFRFNNIPQLTEVPSGIRHLENLKFLDFADMRAEFVESIDPVKGKEYWVIKHVPLVLIRSKVGPRYYDYEVKTIRSSFMQS